MAALLVVLLGQAVYFFLQSEQAVLYRIACVSLSLVVAGLVALWWSKHTAVEEPEGSIPQPDEEEALGSLELMSGLLRGFTLSLVVFGLTAFIGWGGSKLRLEDPFIDRDFAQLVHDVEVLEEAESYPAAIDLIDRRLGSKPSLSSGKQLDLAKKKVEDLLTLGRKVTWWEEKVYYFSLAKETAKRWKLDPSLPDAELRAAKPTATPLPPPTPLPTYTPRPEPSPFPTWTPAPTPTKVPTQTPLPTPTERPTWTPAPTPTPAPPTPTSKPVKEGPPFDPSKCREVAVSERLGAPGNFHAWDCGEWGWYGQWRPSAGDKPVGGQLPQVYVSHVRGRFYLCPPKRGEPNPYTASSCD